MMLADDAESFLLFLPFFEMMMLVMISYYPMFPPLLSLLLAPNWGSHSFAELSM